MTDERTDSDRLITLRRRWEEDSSAQVALQLAEEYRTLGRSEEGLEVLKQAVERFPRHLASRVAQGRYQLDLGLYEEAAGALEDVVEKDPTHLIANKLLVRLYLETGRAKQARDRLDLYRLLNEGDPEIEELKARLDRAQAAETGGGEPTPEPPPVAQARLEEAPPTVVETAAPREQETAVPESAAPGAAAVAGAEEAEAGDATRIGMPFPTDAIWGRVGDEDFWRLFAAEGIFSLPDRLELLAPAGAGPRIAPVQAETVTLAGLYLRQGHLEEAERTFRRVLERDAENREALAGLAEIEGLRRAIDVDEKPASAGEPMESDPRERKIGALRAYLDRLRGGNGRG